MAEPVIQFRLNIKGPDFFQEILLKPGVITLGRDPDIDVPLPHPIISRRHTQIIVRLDGCQIIDLNSANGTILNGQPIPGNTLLALPPASVIQIGPFEIAFEQVQVEAPQPEPGSPPERTRPAPEPDAPPVVDAFQTRALPLDMAAIAAEDEGPPGPPMEDAWILPGLSRSSLRLLAYLPEIYHTPFMDHFLALFESILLPIEWTVDNFDLYLDPLTTPSAFLPWLQNWFDIAADPVWSEEQRRGLLKEAHRLYALRGTRWAMSRVLELLTGRVPEIIEFEAGQEPYFFTIKLPVQEGAVNRKLVERLIESQKPAHTAYRLEMESKS